MTSDPNQPDRPIDVQIDAVLAAMRTAAPPNGMETRIVLRLRHEAVSPTAVPSRMQSLLISAIPSAAFYRGTLTGAAIAAIALSAVLSFKHPSSPQSVNNRAMTSLPIASGTPHATPVSTTPVQPTLCSNLVLRQVHHGTSAPVSHQFVATASAESDPRAHAAHVLPLTAQELALARLATTANPVVLAALNPDNQARQDAEESAEFTKFFTPPPLPPDLNPDTVPEVPPQTNE